ncbi:MAG: RNA polymerase sigma factor [Planctomycetota bacterium]
MSDTRTDGDLLAAHLAGRAGAFEELVGRHAAMVLGACRRLLGAGPDAEDAGQATFVLLARKAGSLRGADDLGAWLHRSARLISRTALRARRRRVRHEKEAAVMRGSGGEAADSERLWREHADRLDDALDSLPTAYRQALVLCYFEGLSQGEAARRLSVPEATLSSRCTRGLEKLRARLGVRERRASVGALGALIAGRAAAEVPSSFVPSAVAAARGVAVSAPILALTEGALKVMFWSKVKVVGAFVAAAAILAAVTPPAVRAISRAAAGEAKAELPAPVDGLRLTVSADRKEFSPGETVKLQLTFENTSKEKMRAFLPPANWLDRSLSWKAEGPGAKQVMVARNMMARLSGLQDYPELAPGEKKTVQYSLRGNPPTVTGWQLTGAGVYKLAVSYTYNMNNPVYYPKGGLVGVQQGAAPAPGIPAPGIPAPGIPAPGGAAPARPAPRGPQPVPGKVWKGSLSSNAVELKLKEYDPAKGIDGLSVKLSAGVQKLKAGDELTLTVTFRNVSREKMKINGYRLANYVRVTGADAGAAGKYFSTARTGVWTPRGPNAEHFSELEPGAEKSYTVKISGDPPGFGVAGQSSRTFLTKPGKYKVSVFYRNAITYCFGAAGGRFPQRQNIEGKVWTGAVGSPEVEVELTGEVKPVPALYRKAGVVGPGGGPFQLMPGQVRPMGGVGN